MQLGLVLTKKLEKPYTFYSYYWCSVWQWHYIISAHIRLKLVVQLLNIIRNMVGSKIITTSKMDSCMRTLSA